MAIEDDIRRVHVSEVRPLVEEAWRCYNLGAARAAVSITWTAVITDIIVKIGLLADDGEAHAVQRRKAISATQELGLKAEGVRQMQYIENSVLDDALTLGLVDGVEKRELERIREDRNLVVHPSLKDLGEQYVPRLATARAHIETALGVLLVHPPIQGKTIISRFIQHVCEETFTPTSTFLYRTFYEHVKDSARRNLVRLAVKHAVSEIEVPEPSVSPHEVADRMAQYLSVVAERERELVVIATQDALSSLAQQGGDTTLRVLGRLGDQEYFWDAIEDSMVDRINDLIARIPIPEPTSTDVPVEVLSLLGHETARARLHTLQPKFEAMPWFPRLYTVLMRPAPFFARYLEPLLRQSDSAEDFAMVGVAMRSYFRHLDIRALAGILSASSENVNVYLSRYGPEIMKSLFAGTRELGDERCELFIEFIETVRAKNDGAEQFSYNELQFVIAAERNARRKESP